MTPRYVALIPLRGGSKSIPKKNIKSMAGKPLCAWALEAAVASTSISQVYVSTDNDEIKSVVDSLGLNIAIIDRPESLATDAATTESVMLHFANEVPFENLITIQATSPLITPKDLDQATRFFEDGHYNSLLTAVRLKRFFWTDSFKPINYEPAKRPRRQDFPGTLMENGAFYITERSLLEATECRLGGRMGVYEMDEATALEVDEPADWLAIEQLLTQRRSK